MDTRIKYIDVLNIFSCFAVICLHHNALVHSWQNSADWAQSLIIQVICFWGVPVFLMLSGATLLTYRQRYDTITFFKRRCQRVLLVFLFWSTLLFICINNQPDIGFLTALNEILGATKMPIYYFFPLIFSMYLLVPVFSLLIEQRATLWYLVGIIFFGYSILNPLAELIGLTNLKLFLPPIYPVFIFFPLGYLLATENLTQKQRILIYAAAVAGMIFRYVWVYHFSMQMQKTDRTLFDYTLFFSVLLASAVFLWIKNAHFYDKWNPRLLQIIASTSLGVYLLHLPFMAFEANVFNLSEDGWVWRFVMPFVTYPLCVGLVFELKQIPYIRRLLP